MIAGNRAGVESGLQIRLCECLFTRAANLAPQDHPYRYGLLLRGDRRTGYPELRGKPVGVGGSSRRGVLTTANYEARKFGCHSAMPVFMALKKCPELLIVPTRFDIYKRDSALIREIFSRFTALDRASVAGRGVSGCLHNPSPGTIIASRIRQRIREETGLTASAGIAPNKLIAKIASDWKKPDGQFTVARRSGEFHERPAATENTGVGGKMAAKLSAMGVETCGEFRAIDRFEWVRRMGGYGAELCERCWGKDGRPVNPDSPRKSLSIENTFSENIHGIPALEREMKVLLDELEEKLATRHTDRKVRSLVGEAEILRLPPHHRRAGEPGD